MANFTHNWNYPQLIAHRGAGKLAPENTLSAIRLGAANGFSMMEFDVKLSQDGVPILLHDDDVDRTSNHQGPASDYTYAQLAELDFGAWHSSAYAGEPIASLYSIAHYTIANQIHSNIEIKPSAGREAETGQRIALLAQQLWQAAALPPLLSSFSESSLAAAKQAAPDMPRALLIEAELPSNWQDKLEELGCIGLNVNTRYLTQAQARAIKLAGYTLCVWTVNEAERVRELLDWGCDAIITDRITTIRPDSF